MPPVSRDEAEEIARRFYRERHHRVVNPRVLEELLAKKLADGRPAHGNPLWLALTLQEMNLLEADDYERADREYARLPGAERMQALQLDEARKLPADVSGVYGELLGRAERGFGKAWADAFVDLIAVSRAGWRESDLRELMPKVSGRTWDDLAFAAVRRVLGAHVVQRGAQAQWDFFHAALRVTVLKRDLADETARRRLHGLAADRLESLPSEDPLRVSETMFHLLGLGDRDRAAEYTAKANIPGPIAAPGLAAAAAVLVEAIQAAPDDTARERLTGWIAGLMDGGDGTRSGRVANAAIFDFSDALAVTGEARTERPRHHLLDAACNRLDELRQRNPQSADYARDLSVSYNKLGDLHLGLGNGAKALEFYEKSLALREELRQRNPQSADYARDLVVSCWRMADVAEKTGQGDARNWWRKAYEQLAGMKARGIMLPTDEQHLAMLKRKLDAVPVEATPPKAPSRNELRVFAEDAMRKCLWDVAVSMFEGLLAAGDPVEQVGPKLVTCLLKVHEPPRLNELARAEEIVARLESAGRSDLAAPLRAEVASKTPTPKKPAWKRWMGG